MRLMTLLKVVCIGLAAAYAMSTQADDRPDPLPQKLVDDWEQAMAKVYWVRPADSGVLEFHDYQEAKKGDIPTCTYYTDWTPVPFAELPQPDRSFGLRIGFKEFNDGKLSELAGIKQLALLDVCNTKVNGSGLKALAGLNNLHVLDLSNTPASDTTVTELANLSALNTLNLYETAITDAGLKKIGNLRTLRWLNVSETKITDNGLAYLAKMPELRALFLDDTAVTDDGLGTLATFNGLEALGLRNTKVTDAGLSKLASLKNLKSLYIDHSQSTTLGAVRVGLPLQDRDAVETRKRIECLIEMLASKNSAPTISHPEDEGEIHFPETYDKALQVPVFLAMEELLREGEESMDLLLKHEGDKRYSLSVNGPNDENLTVSEVCQEIAFAKICCFKSELRLISFDQHSGVPRPINGQTLLEWVDSQSPAGIARVADRSNR